jgi:hypothetical protein
MIADGGAVESPATASMSSPARSGTPSALR